MSITAAFDCLLAGNRSHGRNLIGDVGHDAVGYLGRRWACSSSTAPRTDAGVLECFPEAVGATLAAFAAFTAAAWTEHLSQI